MSKLTSMTRMMIVFPDTALLRKKTKEKYKSVPAMQKREAPTGIQLVVDLYNEVDSEVAFYVGVHKVSSAGLSGIRPSSIHTKLGVYDRFFQGYSTYSMPIANVFQLISDIATFAGQPEAVRTIDGSQYLD